MAKIFNTVGKQPARVAEHMLKFAKSAGYSLAGQCLQIITHEQGPGHVKWGIGNARDMETWNPKLRFLEQTPATARYEKVDTTVVRVIYRLLAGMPFGAYDTLNRFKY